MSIWKIYGGKWWDGQKLAGNKELTYSVSGDTDREFHLSENDIVCGGLVDMHCHLWAKGIHKTMGVAAQAIASSGVVACVDGGSFGYLYWPHADRYWTATSPIITRSYLNIREEGLREWPCDRPTLPNEIDVDLLSDIAKRSKGRIIGIKAHLGFGKDAPTDIGWMEKAREIADKANLPIAVHITNSFLDIEKILSYFKSGDILIHVYQGKKCAPIDEQGRYSQAVIEAHKRGVIMDGAVGINHLSWKVFKAAQEAQFEADVVTTDAVGISWQDKPFRDLPHVMSAFMNAGMDVQTVLKAVTTRPADIMGIPYEPHANLLVLSRRDKPTEFMDSLGETLAGGFEYETTLFALGDKPVVIKI